LLLEASLDPRSASFSREEIARLCMDNLLERSNERIWVKDRESRFLLVSAGWLARYGQGRSVDQVLGRTDADLFSAEHAATARAEELRVMESGEPLLTHVAEECEGEGAVWSETLRLPLRDEQGNIIGTWGLGQTSQTKAEQELVEARARMEASERIHRVLFERHPLPMAVLDRDTRQLLIVNDAACKIYGYSRAEMLAMTTTELVAPEDRAAHVAALQAEPLAGFYASRPARHQHKDGTIVEVEVTSDDVVLDGRACRIAAALDVTERNRAAAEVAAARDEAVEASRMKSTFLANMSHEIRTPMNGVIGVSELLLDTELDDDQRSLALQAVSSGKLLIDLVNDILDISKIEAGQLDVEMSDFALRETIEQACAIAGMQAEGKGLRLELDIADEVPEQIRGDGRRLRQILLNLVSNAVKFTSQGKVTVRAALRDSAEAAVRIEVVDTGIGIEPSILDHMFEPFTQADASTTRNYGGTGFGLAIARQLIELMGGTVGAESELGAGSTFWIELPLVSAAATDGGPSPAASPRLWGSAPCVLVAEDSPVNQTVAVRTLERVGCQADVARSGREALAMLASRHYDAVLMDCQMPELDGYEATAELRRREGAGQHTPVIAMTGDAMDGDRERCLEAGMDDYLSKPIERAALVAVLDRWLPSESSRSNDDVERVSAVS
jgi:PAS domain S-box-containing protein